MAPRQQTVVGKPELVLQTGHTMKVNCVAFGPDGQWLASGGADNTVKLWDATTGRELRSLTGHTGWINALAVSGNGEWLASGSNDRTIKIWNVQGGQELRTLKGHTGSIQSLALSADSHWLASGSADNSVKIWELATGKEILTLKTHTGWITSLAFSGDGKLLASGGADNTVKLWDTANWRESVTLKGQSAKITSLAFSADNRSLAVGSADGTVSSWQRGMAHESFVARSVSGAVLAVLFAQDGQLVSVHRGGTIELRDEASGKEKRKIGEILPQGRVFASFAPDGKMIATGTGDRMIELRSVATGSLVRMLESRSTAFYAVAFSRDGRWLASGGNDRSVRLWPVATGRELPRLVGHTGWVTTLAFSPDSRLLASGSIGGDLKLWDLLTGREAFSLPTREGSINSVAFSPDGKQLAAAGTQQAIQVWDLKTKRARSLVGHAAEVTSIAFSADGRRLVSGGTDKTIRLWDPQDGTLMHTFNVADQIYSIAFSPDGLQIAAGGADKTVGIWEVESGRQLFALAGHRGDVLALGFSPDGRWLASGSSDHTLRLWEAQTGRPVSELPSSSESINSVAFSSDGRWLATGSDDGSMMVWNPQTSKLMATLVSVRDSDDWLVVTPDGLFDGSPPSWNSILWRFAGSTFRVSPVESFFNEFYYPRLLGDILAGRNPRATQDITQKDRRQPRIILARVEPERSGQVIAERYTTVKIDITDSPPDVEHAQGSGARDVRLFRNGLLVRAWPGDVLKAGNSQTIEARIPVVAGDNWLTAYAFNRDNIKGVDAHLSLTGAENLRRTGTAYVLAVGVGQYANPDYKLNYSVADAVDMSEQLRNQQVRLGRYKPVEVVSLLDANATKENILLAIRRLAGTQADPLPKNAPRVLAQLKPALPEDAVIIYFSGHGTAQKDHFYLIPYDLGYSGYRTRLDLEGLNTILAHSISDIELEEALKAIDADQLLLIIDACNSGQALETEEKRWGPMNTRGLAQLAYEKGMYILTASQKIEVAFESETLKHSYLTYALVEEGIKAGAADRDRDGKVLLGEWFDYATERVPGLRQENLAGKSIEVVDPDEQRVQTPMVFYTREAGARNFMIALLAAPTTQ